MSNEELPENLKQLAAEQEKKPQPCKTCGRCPSCGRGALPWGTLPYHPTWPYYHQHPYWQYIPGQLSYGTIGISTPVVTSGTVWIQNNKGELGTLTNGGGNY